MLRIWVHRMARSWRYTKPFATCIDFISWVPCVSLHPVYYSFWRYYLFFRLNLFSVSFSLSLLPCFCFYAINIVGASFFVFSCPEYRVLYRLLVTIKTARPGNSDVPRNPLTRWDVSSIPANGIFLTKALMHTKNLYENGPNPFFFSGPKT